MSVVVTILCDNTISQSGIIGEHGFSLLLERGEEKVLFDTGPGMSLPLNLKALGKNLDGLGKVLISHGHYDHTGGLKWVIQEVGSVEVVAHPGIFTDHMVFDPQKPDERPRHIGCPTRQEELERLGATFTFLDHPEEISPGLWFLAGIGRDGALPPKDIRLVLSRGGELVPDLIEDDASLLLETETGFVLILGCAHAGVLNILRHVREEMGIHKLRAVLGGTHLMFYGQENVMKAIEEFDRFSLDLIGVSHCSGFKAAVELSNHFGDRFTAASAGAVYHF
jgi:7,8-dihydropterin-6-yl-methyl-4-(beta-D-ribofuranosyl)aminobenzene 5'-phosphate synthase